MFGSGMNLITTVIGFGMSTTFIVFICARLLYGRIRSAEARAAAAASAPTAYDLELQSEPDLQPEHSVIGLEPVAVASLPAVNYKKGNPNSNEDAQCSICLGDYQEKEVLRIIPNCGHDFHLTCIDAWLQKHSTCPICRISLHDQIQPKSSAPLVTSQHSSHFLPFDPGDQRIGENSRDGDETLHTAEEYAHWSEETR